MLTVLIMAVLIWLLFDVFVTIWRISVFVQLNRSVHSELIYVTQTIQNMVDDQDMQLTGLDLSGSGGDTQTQGRKQSINFADDEFIYTISKNCTDEPNCFLQLFWIELEPNYLAWYITGSVALTDPGNVTIESFYIRTLPYDSPAEYAQMLHKWFWLFLDIRVPQYDETKRRFSVKQQAQLFFTMRKYE